MRNRHPIAAPYKRLCGLGSSPSPQSPPLKGGEVEAEQSSALKGGEAQVEQSSALKGCEAELEQFPDLSRWEVNCTNSDHSVETTSPCKKGEVKDTITARDLGTRPPIEEKKAGCPRISLSLEGRGRGEGGKNECQRTKAKKQNLTHFSKDLRKRLTDVEHLLWSHLRTRQCEGMKFRRQHPIGQYIVDFVCLEKRLIIELDGGHHALPAEALKDRQRDAWLEKEGYRVLHFWDNEILMNMNGVLEVIRGRLIKTPSP